MSNNGRVTVSENGDSEANWEERRGFQAKLVLEVLQTLPEPTKWRKVADYGVYEYLRNKQKYHDDDVSGILTRTAKGDFFVSTKSINSTDGHKAIKRILEKDGWYIACAPGKGIYLTKDNQEITEDHKRETKKVFSRSDTLSNTAVTMNQTNRTELPTLSVEAIIEELSETIKLAEEILEG